MKKTWIWVVVGLAVAVGAYFIFFHKKTDAATSPPVTSSFGNTLTGVPITEAMIAQEMRSIESYNKSAIQEKATANGKTYGQQLRLDAIWMLQNTSGH